jgi:SH3-like domain-containing protein
MCWPWLRLRACPVFVLALIALTTGCNHDTGPDLGKAYIAPASVALRSQLNQKTSTVAVLKHGEQVTITDVRRRFVKVRTARGAEGWMDSLELLSQAEMDRIRAERQAALKLPSEGTATAYETLNIHIDPSRRSPAFAQIAEGGAVQVLARKATPKVTGGVRPGTAFVVEKPPPPARKPKAERGGKASLRLPKLPARPKPPANWETILGGSKVEEEERDDAAPSKSAPGKSGDPVKPVILEDWTLVRTPDRQTGWVLSRNLMMSIPDEVAQYAGGRHITSFFELGTVNDEEKGLKHDWLWTTSAGGTPYAFDAWRVFLWNRRRHRYETSYRQHDLEGYFPVHVESADPKTVGRRFQIITKDDDGKFRRRTYSFDGSLVHLVGTEDYRPEQQAEQKPQQLDTESLRSRLPKSGWLARKWADLKRRFGHKGTTE